MSQAVTGTPTPANSSLSESWHFVSLKPSWVIIKKRISNLLYALKKLIFWLKTTKTNCIVQNYQEVQATLIFPLMLFHFYMMQ